MFKNANQELLYPSLPIASDAEMETYVSGHLMACNPQIREW